MTQKHEKFDKILEKIIQQVDGASEFLEIIFGFMKRKTEFGLQNNNIARRMVLDAFEKRIYSGKQEQNNSEKELANDSFDEFSLEEAICLLSERRGRQPIRIFLALETACIYLGLLEYVSIFLSNVMKVFRALYILF